MKPRASAVRILAVKVSTLNEEGLDPVNSVILMGQATLAFGRVQTGTVFRDDDGEALLFASLNLSTYRFSGSLFELALLLVRMSRFVMVCHESRPF